MRLLLINPSNRLVQLLHVTDDRWNRYRVWQPLGLMVIAALTPATWQVELIDENLGVPDYAALPTPDLVGITAFTAQAVRAYAVADAFRARGVPVVMGGIHASMCQDEAQQHADAVVSGEAESVWAQVLADVMAGRLQPRYAGGLAEPATIQAARQGLLPQRYAFGSIQTSRGCPLNCTFCSVTAFNGGRYRQRPVADVVAELRAVPERRVLVVDDNLIGTSAAQIAHAKELFRSIAAARLDKLWIGQATINFADDEELLTLARASGCRGVFIGFESTTPAGLAECGKKFNLLGQRDFRASVQRIRRHGILVVGSFIIGLDADGPGVGQRIADQAQHYGVDFLNAVLLTPLPGTRLYRELAEAGRITCDSYPADWAFYTFMYPVSRYRQLSDSAAMSELQASNRSFYAYTSILWRTCMNAIQGRLPVITLIGGLSYRCNAARDAPAYQAFARSRTAVA